MSLPRPIVWLLLVVWLLACGCFVVVAQLAFVSGNTFEYRLYGVQFPFVAFVLQTFMVVSSGLLWANYRDEDFRGAEQLIYSTLLGLSMFGFIIFTVVGLSQVLLG
jgi:tryptophan-rich sensory protein